jgi:hypothetical protein
VERGAVPRLVASNPSAVSVIEFSAAYWEHCRAVSPSEAVEQTNKLCDECAIPIQRRGKKRFLVGVRIKTATGSRARLGPMARKMT